MSVFVNLMYLLNLFNDVSALFISSFISWTCAWNIGTSGYCMSGKPSKKRGETRRRPDMPLWRKTSYSPLWRPWASCFVTSHNRPPLLPKSIHYIWPSLIWKSGIHPCSLIESRGRGRDTHTHRDWVKLDNYISAFIFEICKKHPSSRAV